MRQRLRHYWSFVSGGLWFLPLVMTAAAVLLAMGLLRLGSVLPDEKAGFWLLYSGDADSARDLLSAMLGGMISMTSLVVSITMVVLTLAAGQIGPRLVRSFMADRNTQASLGLFVASIFYLLLVLRTIEGGSSAEVPHAAVTGGTLLTALSLFVLLFFVHRLASSIVYDNVVRRVGQELDDTLFALFPEEPEEHCPPPEDDLAWVSLGRQGYVQSVDYKGLVAAATGCGARVRLAVRPGDFALAQVRAFGVHPASACSDALADRLRNTIVVGGERTEPQDVAFGFQRLTEVATRALSPGINDVFTAIAAIDTISASLAHALGRAPEPAMLRDEHGCPRLFRPSLTHAELVAVAFDPLRWSARSSPAVLRRIAEAIGRLAPCLRQEEHRRALLEQIDAAETEACAADLPSRDLEIVRAACNRARRDLAGADGPSLRPGPRGG